MNELIHQLVTMMRSDGVRKNGHLDVVELLMKDERVDPSANDNYAIRMSAYIWTFGCC